MNGILQIQKVLSVVCTSEGWNTERFHKTSIDVRFFCIQNFFFQFLTLIVFNLISMNPNELATLAILYFELESINLVGDFRMFDIYCLQYKQIVFFVVVEHLWSMINNRFLYTQFELRNFIDICTQLLRM